MEVSKEIRGLVENFPKFFSIKGHRPEKEHGEVLNEFVMVNTRKPHEGPSFNSNNNGNNNPGQYNNYGRATEMIE